MAEKDRKEGQGRDPDLEALMMVILAILGVFGACFAIGWTTHVLFGQMTTSEYSSYFPEQIKGFFQHIKSWFEALSFRATN